MYLVADAVLPAQGGTTKGGIAIPNRPLLRSSAAASPHSVGMLAFAAAAGRSQGLPGRVRQGQRSRTSAVGSTAVATAPVETSTSTHINLGYDRDLEAHYSWGEQLGKGGNGVVRVVTDNTTGEQYACKSIRKVLADASDKKRAGHVDSLRQEIAVLRRLAGSLNVVKLVDVFEDEDSVHIIQEWCKGGELLHSVGKRHYSERTVASYMRAVLRTLAQCHAHHILHRDIKPENFMLLNDDDRSPLKAIDFGLATPYDPDCLPRTDLGLEGTPWYMAPEVLSSQVTPASDLWSAGVMAYQLLTGRMPFDDHRNPFAPSISAVWRSVLTEQLNYQTAAWAGISNEAKDFVCMLLNRDPAQRPTAKEALNHPWLRGNSRDRSNGKQLDMAVVQRIQRFGLNNRFKRSVLQLIAQELLARESQAAQEAACTVTFDDEAGDGSGARDGGRAIIANPYDCAMQEIYDRLAFEGEYLPADKAAEALKAMGYRLQPSELTRLVEQVDTSNSGRVRRAALAASQIDWRYLQRNARDEWLGIARKAFEALDRDADGELGVEDMIASMRAKLPADELQATIQQAMEEAGLTAESQHMTFDGFLEMLRVGSMDSLDLYDGRLGGTPGSLDRLNDLLQSMDGSHHGSDTSSLHGGGSTHNGASLYGAFMRAAAAGGKAGGGDAAGGEPKPWQRPPAVFNFDVSASQAAVSKPAPRTQLHETVGAPGINVVGSALDSAMTADMLVDDVPHAASARGSAAAKGGDGQPQQDTNGSNNVASLSSYFNNGAVRGGGHFDKRMHGASLYRNAVVQRAGQHLYPGNKRLDPVKE